MVDAAKRFQDNTEPSELELRCGREKLKYARAGKFSG